MTAKRLTRAWKHASERNRSFDYEYNSGEVHPEFEIGTDVSIRTILEKYSVGGLDAQVRDAVYLDGDHDDWDISEIARLDIAEREEVLQTVKRQVAELQQQLEKQKQSEKDNLEKIEEAVVVHQKADGTDSPEA